VIGELPPELRVAGGDGGALLRLQQQQQQQQRGPMPPPPQMPQMPPHMQHPVYGNGNSGDNMHGMPVSSAAAAAAAAAAAMAGLRLGNGYPQPAPPPFPQPQAQPQPQQPHHGGFSAAPGGHGPGFSGAPFQSFGPIGGPQQQLQGQQGQGPQQPGLPQPRVPLPRPMMGAGAGAPGSALPAPTQAPPPGARAVPLPMPMPRPPQSPAQQAHGFDGAGATPPLASSPFGASPPAFGRSPPSATRVNQREVREADQVARAADRDERRPGSSGGGGGSGAGGRPGPATLKADAATLSRDLNALAASLAPAPEDSARQASCFERVRAMVVAEWPDAQLLMYGSCANGFGGAVSDIDTCLALRWADSQERKRAVVSRIAELATAAGCTDVVALTHARMPVAKMVDAVTGVACDVCVNNFLAVYNTRLLRDYGGVDARLRPLGYAVKHWAKRRAVNEPYTGTLSSYCYILMCIHLLQTRSPPVLPCLQAMSPSSFVREVDGTRCAYYDDIRALSGFGARNGQTLAHLLQDFFEYWAHGHDYGGAVVSVRTGGIVPKRRKGWTTRVGTERHLICIEDPFEVSHDLGRVVDKRSISVLRDEFARAANILRTHPQPLEALFQPYAAPGKAMPPAGEGKGEGKGGEEAQGQPLGRLAGAQPAFALAGR
jgi:DNA polymerase sigma